jgi:hypothetical protein
MPCLCVAATCPRCTSFMLIPCLHGGVQPPWDWLPCALPQVHTTPLLGLCIAVVTYVVLCWRQPSVFAMALAASFDQMMARIYLRIA